MTDIIVIAPKGHMGRLIIQAAYEHDDINVVGAVGTPGRNYIGKDAGIVAGLGEEIGAKVHDNLADIIDKCDVVVDFSTVETSMKVLEVCLAAGKAYICGTTGFDAADTEKLLKAGELIPMMKAANTSFVVNVMKKLLGQAAQVLGDRCRIEIVEMHSEGKLDAPSGTAIELAEEMAAAAATAAAGDEASGNEAGEPGTDACNTMAGAMVENPTTTAIPIHSIRAGNTPSTHRVIFGCMGEKLEISHDAYDWRCYAEGACAAALYMTNRPPGLYSMEDVIQL